MKAIILGSRERVRRLSARQSYPASLEQLHSGGGTVLDWNMHALSGAGVGEVVYVGGYHIEKVVQKYPFLRFYYHANWQRGAEAEALLVARNELEGDVLIVQSNILLRARAIADLLDAAAGCFAAGGVSNRALTDQEQHELFPFVLSGSIDDARSDGPDGDGRAPLHFAGVLYVPGPKAGTLLQAARTALEADPAGTLVHVLSNVRDTGHALCAVPLDGNWSSLQKSLSLARFVMGTKAQTLERLRPRVKKSVVLPQVQFTVEDWRTCSGGIIAHIQDVCGRGGIAVRSSALHEDTWETSAAGKFHSELNVDGSDPHSIISAVENVIQSYDRGGHSNGANQVLVQPRLENVQVSGVLFTKDLKHGAPYYIINYDRRTSQTDTVTSGRGLDLDTKIIRRGSPAAGHAGWLAGVLAAAREVEDLLACDSLDIEFAADAQDTVYLLQARALIIDAGERAFTDEDFHLEIGKIKGFISSKLNPSPAGLGSGNLLGSMPDWNPSEMIGSCPKPLALSLYQRLITDWAWAEARAQCGYRNVRPEPLMFSLAGKPYVDVRSSFNSFVPARLKPAVAEKLVSSSIAYLRAHPELHDKVEFEVMPNCFDFDFESTMRRLSDAGFSRGETATVRREYLRLTDALLINGKKRIARQLKKFDMLAARRKEVCRYPGAEHPYEMPRQINLLVNDCIEFGTIPFSILARYAFIAMILLRSLTARGVLDEADYEALRANIPTVASQLNRDVVGLQSGTMSKDTFLEKYGHLRPNSYDMCSLNYAAMLERGMFASDQKSAQIPPAAEPEAARAVWDRCRASISRALHESGFTATADDLFEFIVWSIPAREQGKLEFTKNLNAILEKTAAFGAALGLSREEMSFVSIERILRLATDSSSSVVAEEFARAINFQKKRYNLTASLRMPFLIASPEDVECFDELRWAPNFVTTKKVFGQVADLATDWSASGLEEKIVIIEGADPGYDWIFSEPISGLITKYGGAGSHMAIRAAEFKLPAAIGCGEVIYREVQKADCVELDCGSKTIRPR